MELNFNKPVSRNQPWLKIYEEINLVAPETDNRPFAVQLAAHAKEMPDAPALLFIEKIFSYSEYDTQVRKLANALKKLGLGKGDVYAFAVGALSRIGAIGTGLSPLMSPPELAYQISDSKAKVVLALSDLAPLLTGMTEVPACLDSVIITGAADCLAPSKIELPAISGVKVAAYNDIVSPASEQCDQEPSHWNDTFMIQYTGGTTGRPKGAQLTIRNIMHNPAVNSALGLRYKIGEDISGTPFPMFHIAGLYSLASSVRSGCLFYLLPNPRELGQFIKYMKKYPPTVVGAVPALTEMLLATPEFADVDLSKLKAWGSGAAPISRPFQAKQSRNS